MTDAMQRRWVVDMVRILPQNWVSRAWGWLARRQHPRPGVQLFKRAFVVGTGIHMADAIEPDIGAYPSLEALFVRKLKAGLRPVDAGASTWVSPVDGTVGQVGTVTGGTLLQVKGRAYSLASLLGSEEDAEVFEGGHYVTLYLAPNDYHRIHAPLGGQVAEAHVIPGGLMPVFKEAVEQVESLFARNERIITYIDSTAAGRVAVVKVGATMVGRISLAYDPEVWSNMPGGQQRRLNYTPAHAMDKGDELGTFELGSTVLLVFEPQRVSLDPLHAGDRVLMGQRLGVVTQGGESKRHRDAPRGRNGPRKTVRRAPPSLRPDGKKPPRDDH